jgi:putative transposase
MRVEWDVSIRRACRVFAVDTSTYHYKSRRPGRLHLSKELRRSAGRGFATATDAFMSRDASIVNWGCNYAPKHRSGGSRPSSGRIVGQPRTRTRPWAMDFDHDTLATGRKLRVLTIVDIFSRTGT